jgi:hypothetical protein
MIQIKKILFIAFIFILGGCEFNSSNESQSANDKSLEFASSEFSVTGVNDFQFLFNDTEIGGIINFESSEIPQCTLAFKQAKFIQGFKASTTTSKIEDFDVTCLTDDDNYSVDDSDKTFAKMKVDEVSEIARVTLSFSLVGYNTQKLMVKEKVVLVINSKQLKALLSK